MAQDQVGVSAGRASAAGGVVSTTTTAYSSLARRRGGTPGTAALAIPPPLDRECDGYPLGPRRLVLLGPPGTGKTSNALDVWILSALRLGVTPAAVLSCSFTRAAAGELRGRLQQALGLDAQALRESCSTVHAEAFRRVRSWLGERRFKVLGEPQDDGPPSRIPEAAFAATERERIRTLWDLARNALVLDPESEAFAAFLRAQAPEISLTGARAEIRRYESEKARASAIDFTDMLIRALDCPAPERELLVVDEAQDSTPLQWALIERWAESARFVVLVGDFDQTVYEWAGARPEKLFDLVEAGYEVRRLEQSFRVPRAAHAIARRLILRNRTRIDAPYKPAARDGALREVAFLDALKALDGAPVAGRSAFVLSRSARGLKRWAASLTDRVVPFANERGASPLGARKEVAKVRAIVALRDGRPLARADVHALAQDLPARPVGRFFSGQKKVALHALKAVSDSLALADLAALGLRLDELRTLGLRDALLVAKLGERADPLTRLVERHGPAVLDALPSVTLTTMHGSKGREADLVVVDLKAPRPTRRAVGVERTSALEAERRVVYVALTRAKDELLLVRGARHDLGTLVALPPVASVLASLAERRTVP